MNKLRNGRENFVIECWPERGTAPLLSGFNDSLSVHVSRALILNSSNLELIGVMSGQRQHNNGHIRQ